MKITSSYEWTQKVNNFCFIANIFKKTGFGGAEIRVIGIGDLGFVVLKIFKIKKKLF